jgi:phosphatidate cytidylyltransferase
VIAIIFYGGWLFTMLSALCIGIALKEWLHISKHISTSKGTLLVIAGVFYLGLSLFEIVALREHDNGEYWTIIFMLAIWASDSGAYLFGKTFGGKKMSPTISPNKTWSGYIGALLFPALILFIATQIAPPDFLLDKNFPPTAIPACLAGIAIGMSGQAGDLLISLMKRKAGLKDTGALIPGHGGILDRIDALLLALPVFLCYIKFVTEQ